MHELVELSGKYVTKKRFRTELRRDVDYEGRSEPCEYEFEREVFTIRKDSEIGEYSVSKQKFEAWEELNGPDYEPFPDFKKTKEQLEGLTLIGYVKDELLVRSIWLQNPIKELLLTNN